MHLLDISRLCAVRSAHTLNANVSPSPPAPQSRGAGRAGSVRSRTLCVISYIIRPGARVYGSRAAGSCPQECQRVVRASLPERSSSSAYSIVYRAERSGRQQQQQQPGPRSSVSGRAVSPTDELCVFCFFSPGAGGGAGKACPNSSAVSRAVFASRVCPFSGGCARDRYTSAKS